MSRHHSTSSNCSDALSTRSEEDLSSENGAGRRNRTIFTKKQASELEKVFQRTHYPDLKCRHEISKMTKLSENRIQVCNYNLFASVLKFASEREVLPNAVRYIPVWTLYNAQSIYGITRYRIRQYFTACFLL